MDSKQLRTFREVARQQSFSKAAEKLHIAQPAVSMAIRKLETELGLSLFHRSDRQIKLTDEGERLLTHANLILKNLSDAQQEMQALRGLEQGNVRIGIPSMLGSYYFPPILMAFKHRYPKLSLEVVEGGTWQIQQMVEQGELDLGVIVAEVVPATLETATFLQEQMLVTVGKDHPFAAQQSITYTDFFSEELVMFKPGYFHRKVVDRLANELQVKPNIGFETNLIPLIKSIVKSGFGISTLLQMVVADDPDLVAVPFATPVWLNLSVAWSKDRYLSHANQTFVDFMLDYCSSQTTQRAL